MNTPKALASVLLTLVLLAAACGSDDDSDDVASEETSTSEAAEEITEEETTTTTEPAAEEEGATARAKHAEVFAVGALAAARLEDPAEVLFFLESGRAGSLLETLGGRQAMDVADVPAGLVDAEVAAKTRLARARQAHAQALATGRLPAIRKAARAVDDALRTDA